MTAAWTAPSLTEIPPRYFEYDGDARSWREIDPNGEPSLGGEVPVSVRRTGDAAETYHLICECYYGPHLRCELTVSQPLPVALALFGALLDADTAAEGGALALPAVA